MPAAVTITRRHIEIQDVSPARPDQGEVVVAVERVGICGSDVHLFTGDHPYTEYPQIQGHEFCGVVAAVAEGTDTSLSIGDRVAVEPLISCGVCYPCRRGRYNCCAQLQVIGAHLPGALQSHLAVPAANAHAIGDLTAELGALCEPMSIALQAVTRADVRQDERVLVLGAGAIGQGITLAASKRGAKVMVTDLIHNRLTLAERLGADVTVHAESDDLSHRVATWTDGDGPAVVFDATGVPAMIRSGFDLVAFSGRLVIVGLNTKDVAFPIVEFTRRELTVLGSRNNAGLFPAAVELVRDNADRVSQLITQRFALDDTQEAMTLALDKPAQTMKVMIEVGNA